jgi:replicative DNA helicase
VVLFSLEMSAFDIWTRIFCDQIGIKSSDFMHRQLSQKEKDAIQDFIKNAAPRGFLISDKGGRTPLSMRSELARIQAKHGQISMVGVDYIQLMTNPGKKNKVEEIGSISNFLKRTSVDFWTRMLVAAQLNRMMDNRPGDDKPKLSDLKESGSIEQDSDLVLLIHRPGMTKKPKDGIVLPDEIMIPKQRRGRLGTIPMDYQGEYYRFVERAK